jgi:hypothetical protein
MPVLSVTVKTKFKVHPKKNEYGWACVGTETYSFGCPSGPSTIYGIDYKITDPNAEGHTDHTVGTFKRTFKNSGTKYKGTLNIDMSIEIP